MNTNEIIYGKHIVGVDRYNIPLRLYAKELHNKIKTTNMTTKITTAKATQSAIPEMGREEKTLYYIIIGEGEEKIVINTGEKNYEAIKNLEKKQNAKK